MISVVMVGLATGRAQVQTFGFGPVGVPISDGRQQQQVYQAVGAPIQGLRLQLTNPGGFNLLQGPARTLPPSAINQQ
jgi:hypothetical protein